MALIVSDNHRNLREYYLQDELHDVFQKAGYFNNKRNIELLLNSVDIDIESPRDNIFADSNLYKEALEEANRRKERNLALFSDLKCDDCKKTKIKSQNEKSVKASCDTKEQTNEKSKIVYLFSDGIAAGKKRTEKKTRKVYNRFEKFIGLDRLDLYFDAHVVGFDGENFLYSVYFDDNSGDGHTEMVQTAMDKLTQSFEQEYGYIGYIDVSEEDDKVVIFLDLGGSDNCENAIVAVLNALNNLSGIKTVLINEEE